MQKSGERIAKKEEEASSEESWISRSQKEVHGGIRGHEVGLALGTPMSSDRYLRNYCSL